MRVWVERLNIAETHSPNLEGLPIDVNFVILMSNKENIVTNALAKYIFNCLKCGVIVFHQIMVIRTHCQAILVSNPSSADNSIQNHHIGMYSWLIAVAILHGLSPVLYTLALGWGINGLDLDIIVYVASTELLDISMYTVLVNMTNILNIRCSLLSI